MGCGDAHGHTDHDTDDEGCWQTWFASLSLAPEKLSEQGDEVQPTVTADWDWDFNNWFGQKHDDVFYLAIPRSDSERSSPHGNDDATHGNDDATPKNAFQPDIEKVMIEGLASLQENMATYATASHADASNHAFADEGRQVKCGESTHGKVLCLVAKCISVLITVIHQHV